MENVEGYRVKLSSHKNCSVRKKNVILSAFSLLYVT